jgi:hypothetical protein
MNRFLMYQDLHLIDVVRLALYTDHCVSTEMVHFNKNVQHTKTGKVKRNAKKYFKCP